MLQGHDLENNVILGRAVAIVANSCNIPGLQLLFLIKFTESQVLIPSRILSFIGCRKFTLLLRC
jgi:hypothetical protein